MYRKPLNPQQRLKNIFNAQRQRAKKFAQQLDYSLEDLDALWRGQKNCPYCGVLLILANLSIDHKQPVSRGGSFKLENLVPCCAPCNREKGILCYEQFLSLVELLTSWNDYQSFNDVLVRLRVGAALKHGWRPRRKRRKQ